LTALAAPAQPAQPTAQNYQSWPDPDHNATQQGGAHIGGYFAS
jgi:hypothetical protein